MKLLWVSSLCVCIRMWSRRYWKTAYVPSQMQRNKGKKWPSSSGCQTARDASCSYWYACVCRLDGDVYITYLTKIKCWACQAVMRGMKSTKLLLMHEAVRNHCWTPLRGMAALTKCHSLPTLSLVPLSQSLSWSPCTSVCLITVNGWMLVRLECHFTPTTVKYEKGLVWRTHRGVPCSEPPMVWRWQTGHKQSSSWP